MSRPASPWPIAAWLMATFTVLALGVSILGRVLSASLVLDLAALWPLLVPVIPALGAVVLRPRSRLAGAAPLIVLTWLLAGLALHLSGWDALPSSVADVTSTAVTGAHTATLTFRLEEGRATVQRGEVLSASMERIGGRTGAPQVELVGSDPIGVSVTAGVAEGWFRFGGVIVSVPAAPSWGVDITAPVVELDLTELQVRSAVVTSAAGLVRLGPVSTESTLVVSGPVRIIVPEGVSASVSGPARVPSDWTSVGDIRRAPTTGEGWVIEVDDAGGSVAISYP